MTEKINTILVHCGSCKNQWLSLPQSTLLHIVAEMMEKMIKMFLELTIQLITLTYRSVLK